MSGKVQQINKPLVYLIDSDEELQLYLSDILSARKVVLKCYANVEHFLREKATKPAHCMIIEVDLPNQSGLELLEGLNRQGWQVPTIVLCSNSDVATAVRAMHARAIEFIEKPVVHRSLADMVMQILRPW